MIPYGILSSTHTPITLDNLKLVLAQDGVLRRAQTYSFTVLGMSQLFHAVGMRDMNKSIFKMNPYENKFMIAACFIGFFVQLIVTENPFLINAFGTVHLSVREWMRLALLSAFTLFAHEILGVTAWKPKKKKAVAYEFNLE